MHESIDSMVIERREIDYFLDYSYIRSMKRGFIYILFFAFLPLFGNSQKLVENIKRRHLGTYVGEISSYRMNTGNDVVKVGSTPIEIRLTKEKNIQLIIGNQKRRGAYRVLFKGRGYYVLDASIEGREANERIVVYNWGKKITRDGMFPQPNASLEKLSRRELRKRNE